MERIQSPSNHPEANAYTAMEVSGHKLLHQARAERKHPQAHLKSQAARKPQQAANKERLNMHAAEEVELRKRDWPQTVDYPRQLANSTKFPPNDFLRKFNRALQKTYVEKENEALRKSKQEQRRNATEQKRKEEEERRASLQEAMRQERERAHQRRLNNHSVKDFQVGQMQKKKELREKVRQQETEERDRLRHLDELHAKELRYQAQKKAESKKSNLKCRLEDMASRNLHREKEAQKLRMMEKERKRVESQVEEKQQQRKKEQAEKFRKRQIQIEIAAGKLAVRMKEQAATEALREQETLSKKLAEQHAREAKQQKEKEEKRAAMLKSISAHREAKIQEKKQKEKAERKSNLEWLQAQRESDRLFLQEEKQKAQTAREKQIEYRDFNVALVAKRRAMAEQLKREEHEAAVKNAEEAAESEKQLQQYIQSEIHKAAEDQRNVSLLLAASKGVSLGRGDLSCSVKNKRESSPRLAIDSVTKGHQERESLPLEKVDKKPTRLPPLPRAAKPDSSAKGSGGGRAEGSNSRAKGAEKPLPRLSTSKTRSTRENPLRNKPQLANEEAAKPLPKLPRLPPISKRIK